MEFDVAKCYEMLSDYQKDKVVALITKYSRLNEELSDTQPTVCPCCHKESSFIKKGFSLKKQRYQCKNCGKKFTYDAGSLTAWSHQPIDAWIVAIEDTLSFESLDSTSNKINVCHTTAFYMRHKILCALENVCSNMAKLEGIIEADEAYILESDKGRKLTERKPRRHGSKATKRGLSHEQLCICTATDRNSGVVLTCVNRAKASSEDIYKALNEYIEEKSVLLCDGADSYNKLIAQKDCQKIELIGYESYGKVYHLNTVNGIHSDLKDMIRRFHGISTKYLNRYLAMLSFIEMRSAQNISELSDCLRAKICDLSCFKTTKNIREYGLLTI